MSSFLFSDRYSLRPIKEIQIGAVDPHLFNRLWNIFFEREYDSNTMSLDFGKKQIGKTEQILDRLGFGYIYPEGAHERNKNVAELKKQLQNSAWYVIYDFIEYYINLFPTIP